MSVELTRRMVQAGVIAESDALALLHDALREQRPLLGLLAERDPGLAGQVEREVVGAGEVEAAPPADPALLARLPPGLCQRLLAAPLGLEPGGVVVLVADGLDDHAARELAHFLRVPVARTVVAPVRAVLTALVSAHRAGAPAPASVRPPAAPERVAEPVAPAPDRPPGDAGAVERARGEIERAAHPDALLQALAEGLSGVCRGVLVLVLRGNAYEGRAGVTAGSPAALRELRLPADDPTLAAAESNLGSLGPLPWAGAWREARGLLGLEGPDDAYLTVVPVEERPLVLIIGAGFDGAYEASRAIDDLGRTAAAALLRLILARRRPSP